MNQLSAATEARTQKSLSKLYRFDGVVMTLGAYLDSKEFEVVEREEGKIEYNRRKFNNMDYREQAEYERKLAEKVTRYYAQFSDGSMLTIPKLVADHYKEQA
mgnify:CR=1 FL=1